MFVTPEELFDTGRDDCSPRLTARIASRNSCGATRFRDRNRERRQRSPVRVLGSCGQVSTTTSGAVSICFSVCKHVKKTRAIGQGEVEK